MRDELNMALMVSESERAKKVWQPWYNIDETDSVGKELPSKLHRENRIRARSSLQKSPRKQLSPRYGPPRDEVDMHALRYQPHYIVSQEESQYEDDEPLDMSIKRRSPPAAHVAPTVTSHASTPPPPPIAHSYTPPLPFQLGGKSPPPAHCGEHPSQYIRQSFIPSLDRPSVIRSPRYALHHPDDDRPAPPPPSYSTATAYLRYKPEERSHRVPARNLPLSPHIDSGRQSSSPTESHTPTVRVEEDAGVLDIDEHFKRSLGENYQQLLQKNPSEEPVRDSTDSVDEHFQKALGDTWLKLKGKSDAPRRPSASNSPLSLPPPVREHVALSARSATPPEPIYKGTPDVSITRVPASSSQRPFLGQVARLGGHPS